jgi:methylphosphotriester-DNA--protein-cysteine methyltransferase
MKEDATNPKRARTPRDEMRLEYDFSNAVRGKYYKRYMESTNVVVLDPDVAAGFKNSEAVNNALRALLRVAQESTGLTPAAAAPATRERTAHPKAR